MRLLLCALLTICTVPIALAQSPGKDASANLDGQWNLLTLEMNGKNLNTSHVKLSIRNNMLVLNESRSMPPIVLDFGPGHLVRMWSVRAPSASPPVQYEEEVVDYGDPTASPGRRQWVIDPVSGAAILAPVPRVPLSNPRISSRSPALGFFLQDAGKLSIFFLPDSTAGPSLTLVLKKD